MDYSHSLFEQLVLIKQLESNTLHTVNCQRAQGALGSGHGSRLGSARQTLRETLLPVR